MEQAPFGLVLARCVICAVTWHSWSPMRITSPYLPQGLRGGMKALGRLSAGRHLSEPQFTHMFSENGPVASGLALQARTSALHPRRGEGPA